MNGAQAWSEGMSTDNQWQSYYGWRRPWDELPEAIRESWRQVVKQEQENPA